MAAFMSKFVYVDSVDDVMQDFFRTAIDEKLAGSFH